ncbi:MAG TPA: hypothetical protein VF503_01605 [Sphingobium sp.]|uniref:hypothetical protein n=1 Tax=Sphingobium sp. TaxID=1912891 RepID=UPI002ED44AA5
MNLSTPSRIEAVRARAAIWRQALGKALLRPAGEKLLALDEEEVARLVLARPAVHEPSA